MKRIAIADCNNFFASCERVFNPKLIKKPVVVLSSNDGCIIARSNEAKALGIKMGEPFFKCADLIKKHNVFVFSSNFSLYGDMSARVMQTISELATDIEIYSIDEAFFYMQSPVIDFKTNQEKLDWYTNHAKYIKKQVYQKTGLPMSIGIGPTKTLAKIANKIAKKFPEFENVFDITNLSGVASAKTDHPKLDDILKNIEVGDVWGIGYRYAEFLKRYNIKTAYDFKQCDEAWVRKNLTINGLKTLLELKGTSCIKLEDNLDEKKSITVSRLFGKNITELNDLKEAVSYHITRAAEKLRRQNMSTSVITIFIAFANYYDPHKQYLSSTVTLPIASSYTPTLIQYAIQCLEKIYKKGVTYKKAGIILSDFCSASSIQLNPFEKIPNIEKQSQAMATVDKINSKMGKNKLFFAISGTKHIWQPKLEKKSPCYTTNWHDILTVKI